MKYFFLYDVGWMVGRNGRTNIGRISNAQKILVHKIVKKVDLKAAAVYRDSCLISIILTPLLVTL